jgi:caspase domain-containing protein/Sel1 repeat-containing protein/putative peptidoglycan binding protein
MRRVIQAIAIAMVWLSASAAYADSDRIALLLGLGDYDTLPDLKNTRNDARGMAKTLDGIGFDVTLGIDLTGAEMRQLLDDFSFRSETAELALIYFAGHGVEVQGENYMIPVDADISSNMDVKRQSISLTQMLTTVERTRKMRIVILDACRNNPLGDFIDEVETTNVADNLNDPNRLPDGLAPVDPERGTLVAFAARDGQVALDGAGDNSPYALALMDKMVIPGLEISLMFRQIRDKVLKDTFNLQEPFTYGSLTGIPFYLAGAAEGQQGLTGATVQDAWASLRPDQEQQLLALADLGDTRSMLGLAYIRLNPNEGRFDPPAAVSFLERAADAGSPEAQFELAKLYERGTGVPVDEKRALELYQAAADQDFADAINDLGFLHYQGGLGLPPNPQKALEFFERAADLRHPQAQFNFAALIDDGLIPSKGPEDAAKYLYAALRSGSADVLNLLTERPTMFTNPTRRALQEELKRYKFYAGKIDGEFGPGTQQSIRAAYGLTD